MEKKYFIQKSQDRAALDITTRKQMTIDRVLKAMNTFGMAKRSTFHLIVSGAGCLQ